MSLGGAIGIFALSLASCLAQAPSVLNPVHESAERFVRRLIALESSGSKAEEEAQAGLRGAEAIYAPSLLSLIREDRREAHSEVGRLDFDPICACQDVDGLSLTDLKIVPLSGSRADAVATLHFPEPSSTRITYHLLLTAHGWRINDVSTKDVASLQALLRAKQ